MFNQASSAVFHKRKAMLLTNPQSQNLHQLAQDKN
jgi:hypothetical protein